MAGELRCKAIRYKTALPLIRGGGGLSHSRADVRRTVSEGLRV